MKEAKSKTLDLSEVNFEKKIKKKISKVCLIK